MYSGITVEDFWFVLSTVAFSVVTTNRQGALRQQNKKDNSEDILISTEQSIFQEDLEKDSCEGKCRLLKLT